MVSFFFQKHEVAAFIMMDLITNHAMTCHGPPCKKHFGTTFLPVPNCARIQYGIAVRRPQSASVRVNIVDIPYIYVPATSCSSSTRLGQVTTAQINPPKVADLSKTTHDINHARGLGDSGIILHTYMCFTYSTYLALLNPTSS